MVRASHTPKRDLCNTNPVSPQEGLTAIELLIITSVVAIVLIIAAPVLSKAAKPSDVDLAVQNTESFINHARATARVYKTDVLMRIAPSDYPGQQAIKLTIPEMKKDASMNEVEEEFLLPEGVRLLSVGETIHFKSDGEIGPPARTLVLYNLEHDKARELVIR